MELARAVWKHPFKSLQNHSLREIRFGRLRRVILEERQDAISTLKKKKKQAGNQKRADCVT